MLHRFFVVSHKCYRKKFLDKTEHHTLWLGYSQNIAFNEEKQVESAHFSGGQHNLHNTIIQSPGGKILYIYHLSDDTSHDSIMTFPIIRDILKHHPEIIEKGVLVLRSDNCQEQYQCKFTFYEMKKSAIEFGIKIIGFYGEPGHGHGLVDAMSSFGSKEQLHHEIVTNDSWFQNAEEMVQFLTQYFSTDNSKEYNLADAAETAKVRGNKTKELELRPCRKFHVIAVTKMVSFPKCCISQIQILPLLFLISMMMQTIIQMLMKMQMMIKLMNLLLV